MKLIKAFWLLLFQMMLLLAKHELEMVPESSSQEKMGFSTQDFTNAASLLTLSNVLLLNVYISQLLLVNI